MSNFILPLVLLLLLTFHVVAQQKTSLSLSASETSIHSVCYVDIRRSCRDRFDSFHEAERGYAPAETAAKTSTFNFDPTSFSCMTRNTRARSGLRNYHIHEIRGIIRNNGSLSPSLSLVPGEIQRAHPIKVSYIERVTQLSLSFFSFAYNGETNVNVTSLASQDDRIVNGGTRVC